MSRWHMVGSLDDFEVDLPEEVRADGVRIAIHRTAAGLFATGAVCTHAEADLRDGFLEGNVLVCPRHLARFDVRTGAALSRPARTALATYECEVRGSEVWVRVPAPLPEGS